MIYEITIHRAPMGKQSVRLANHYGYSRSFIPEKSREWMNEVGWAFKKKYVGHKLITGPIGLEITAHVPIPGRFNGNKTITSM